jgi:hypothetical protein
MVHKRRSELCNRAGTHSNYAIRRQPDLCRVRSFRPEPSNRAGSHSKSIRNRSGSPVVGNHSRSPAAAGNNTAPRRARVCESRSRKRSQQPRAFSLYALCRPVFLVSGRHCLSLSWPRQCLNAASRRLVRRRIGRLLCRQYHGANAARFLRRFCIAWLLAPCHRANAQSPSPLSRGGIKKGALRERSFILLPAAQVGCPSRGGMWSKCCPNPFTIPSSPLPDI